MAYKKIEKVNIEINLPKSVVKKLDEHAEELDITRTSIINAILIRYVLEKL